MNILSCCLLAAINISLGELPPCDYADTEVSTNIPVSTVHGNSTRQFTFALSLEASPSNAVEVAIGTDANDDGCLSAEESAYTFGYDCGTWFCRDTARNQRDDLDTVPDTAYSSRNRIKRTFRLNDTEVRANWNLIRITRRGAASVGDRTSVRGCVPSVMLLIK